MTVSVFKRNAWIRSLTLCGVAGAVVATLGCSAPAPRPRLAVLIVVDMLPAQEFDRFAKHFGNGGFKRFMRDGAWFTDARFSYGALVTASGHATLATGALPSEHGIVHNRWFESGSTQPVGCVANDDIFVTGSAQAGILTPGSPHRLLVPTIGDRLKEHYGDTAKVWSGALKDRAAVLMGGHKPDGAVWWTEQSGDYISSSHYFPQLPRWCEAINEEHYADGFFQKTWERAMPLEAYTDCDEDDVPYEAGHLVLWNNKLPKKLGGGSVPAGHPIYYGRLRASPFGNDLVFRWAREAVINESLGADETPDLLCISLSSLDVCGHFFGINSQEMLDMMVHTDRQLAEWLAFLDEKVGLDNCDIVLTGDHGAGTTPEYAQKKGLDGGRVDVTDLFQRADGALREKFGPLEEGVYYLTATDLPWLYLNESTLGKKRIAIDEAEKIVAKAVGTLAGIESVIVPSQLRARSRDSLTPLERAVVRSTYPGRSGHVFVQLKPNWYKKGLCGGHDTAHACDAHVPLFFMGKAFRKGRYDQPVEMRDVAPTLSKALGIAPPAAATGKVLHKALR